MVVPRILVPLIAISFTIVILACNSSVEPDYTIQASAHIAPDSIYSNVDHKLTMGLIIQTPQRLCWGLDFAGYGHDTDTVRHVRFTYVTATIKKLSTATNCLFGLDTVRAKVTIPFDSAGNYYVDFPQVDKNGYLIQRRYTYTVN